MRGDWGEGVLRPFSRLCSLAVLCAFPHYPNAWNRLVLDMSFGSLLPSRMYQFKDLLYLNLAQS